MLVEQTMHLMASTITVHLDVEDGEVSLAQQAVEASQEWFADVAARFTRFTNESELSRLNANAGNWQDVSEDLFVVVAESIVAAEASDGLFDPALLSLLEAIGYDRDFASFAHRESRTEWRVARDSATTGRWREITLDAANRRIRLPEGCRLDFGGIVKGWSADMALERCFADFTNVLISVGGDMRARGGS